MNRKLLQQALDALKMFKLAQAMEVHWAIAALEAELAKPEPTPVAWRKKVNGVWHYFDESTPFPFDDCEPLYEKN
jgi:hypothetical protein